MFWLRKGRIESIMQRNVSMVLNKQQASKHARKQADKRVSNQLFNLKAKKTEGKN